MVTKLLYTLTWKEGQPSVEQICAEYGLEPEELDPKFGIIEIDPEQHLYSILVDEEAVQRLEKREGQEPLGLEGPFSDARIAPFGPPEE